MPFFISSIEQLNYKHVDLIVSSKDKQAAIKRMLRLIKDELDEMEEEGVEEYNRKTITKELKKNIKQIKSGIKIISEAEDEEAVSVFYEEVF